MVLPTCGRAPSVLTARRSSAIAHHNGLVTPLAIIHGPAAYQELMQRFEHDSNSSRTPDHLRTCRLPRVSSSAPKEIGGWLDFLQPVWQWSTTSRRAAVVDQPSPVEFQPLDANASVLYDALHDLQLAVENGYNTKPPRYTGVVIPEWFTNAQTCSLMQAVHRLGSDTVVVDYPTAAAFTTRGLDLRAVSSDWMPDPPSWQIMTLQYAPNALTAAIVETPSRWRSIKDATYLVNRTLGRNHLSSFSDLEMAKEAIAAWINTIPTIRKPDRVMLIGTHAEHPVFRDAVAQSDVASLVEQEHSSVPVHHSAAIGIAMLAKYDLENHPDDCLEFDECQAVRREADRLAGQPKSSYAWLDYYPEHQVEL